MVEFTIHTWGCPACEYVQDFEPTAENMALHFENGKAGECPSCRLAAGAVSEMVKLTDPSKKAKMVMREKADVDLAVAEAEAEPVQKIVIGKAKRLETAEEMVERISQEVKDKAKTPEDKQELKAALDDAGPIEIEVDVTRNETSLERQVRLQKIRDFPYSTEAEIAETRAKFEDKD